MTVLGISLGSRVTGIVILKNNELLVCRSLTLRTKGSSLHTKSLKGYIRQYRILIVVIKIPPATHITDRLKVLLADCLALFKYHGCMVEYRDTEAIKAYNPTIKNKLDLMRFVSLAYPDLLPLEKRELAGRQKYHTKMFEAVAIAHLKKEEG